LYWLHPVCEFRWWLEYMWDIWNIKIYTFTLGMDNCLVIHLYIFTKCKNNGRRVWRYQRSNQNPYIEEEQTTQWPKEKTQKDKQRLTKHTYKTKDRVTRTPLKTESEFRFSGRVSSSCSTRGTCRVNLSNRGITPERKKWQKPEIKIDLPFMVADLVFTFQMIFLRFVYWSLELIWHCGIFFVFPLYCLRGA